MLLCYWTMQAELLGSLNLPYSEPASEALSNLETCLEQATKALDGAEEGGQELPARPGQLCEASER